MNGVAEMHVWVVAKKEKKKMTDFIRDNDRNALKKIRRSVLAFTHFCEQAEQAAKNIDKLNQELIALIKN